MPGEWMLNPLFMTIDEEGDEMMAQFGSIFTDDGSDSQTISSGTFGKITQFLDNGISSDNVVPDAVNNKITLNQTGVWCAFMSASYAGSANTIWDIHVFVDGVKLPEIGYKRKLSAAAGDIGAGADRCQFRISSTGIDVDIRAEPDGASKDIDINMIKLLVERVSD